MELESAQETFVQLLGQLKPECKLQFLDWVHSEYSQTTAAGTHQANSELEELPDEPELLEQICADLRSVVPPTAIAPGETQLYPAVGENSGLSPANTLHVDSFLYPKEEDVDELCAQLDISRNYCLNCGSWKTLPLNFISHSMSHEQLKFIFCDLLPDLSGKTVLDIGSRMGPVLYASGDVMKLYITAAPCGHYAVVRMIEIPRSDGILGYLGHIKVKAHVHSRAQAIIGIEINSYFSDLQARIIFKYGLSSRVKVVSDDVRHQTDLLQSADVIVMNNVFEFFCSLEEQATIWEFLYKTIRKKGQLLITVPSIQESCRHLILKEGMCLDRWVTEVSTGVAPDDEELSNIHLYCIL